MRIGTDIVEVARIARALSGENAGFSERVFTPGEREQINLSDPNVERASGFWAAKEAIVKAVGYGFRNGIRFQDIEITHDEYGCPKYRITGKLKDILDEQGVKHISLSISHCRTYAIAATVIY